MPLISIDLEPKGLYNASRCAYIINVRPFPRREGNCAWAPSLAQAVTLDSRSVETGRSPSYLSIMLHIHCFYSLHSIPRLISRLYISSKDIPYYCKPHDLCWESSLTGFTRRRCNGTRFLSFSNQLCIVVYTAASRVVLQ